MSGFLLDTNCISELVRIKPDSNVTTWIEEAEKSLLYLSVLTLGRDQERIGFAPSG
jgi:predicted nucleic acid-binding protein